MLKKNVFIGLMLFMVLMPTALLAQKMMYGKWWQDKAIINELQLTDNEITLLNEKYTESRRKMIESKSDMEKHRFELELLLGARELDKQKLMERFDSLERTRMELSKERFEMLINVREILGTERFQELESMRHRRDERGKRRFSHGSIHDQERETD